MVRAVSGQVAWVWLACLSLSACTVGPDYVRPPLAVGEQFRQAEGWVPATPGSLDPQEAWWLRFDDPGLNALMQALTEGNLSILQAEANYRQALTLLRSANAALYPTVGLSADLTRSDTPVLLPGSSAVVGDFAPYTQYGAGLGVAWEIDLWGGVARSVEAARASATASAADLAAVRLSSQAALASTYFQVRVLDVQVALLERTVAAYLRSLQLTQNLQAGGLADVSDVAVARTQYETTRAQLIGLRWQRTQLENAVAVLLGRAPSTFTLPAVSDFVPKLPEVPVGLPSTLLQRRPDIAAAERRTAAANAQIGVATSAWFPDLTLSANAGFQSRQFAQWFSAPAQFWALGPALALALFDGGRRAAQVDQARATFDAQAAAYRLTVLRALQEVEDSLVQLRVLADEQKVQRMAVQAAEKSLRIKQNQFKAGLVDYLSVAVLETTALNNQRTEIGIMGNRLAASVRLVVALGGGWSTEQLPNPGDPVRTP